jgi:hypothetical protein
MSLRALFAFSAAVALYPLPAAHASGAGKGHSSSGSNPISSAEEINQPLSPFALKATPKTIFQRVIQARLYQSGTWTLDQAQTPVTVARTLSSLRPSFVTGLVRLSDHGELSNAEADCFNTVRSAVTAADKSARVDVVINAGVEQSGEHFVRRMREVTSRIHPDAWTFYVAPDNVSVNPEIFAEGIAFAHEAGQFVGYDGPLSLIPEGADFIVVRAWDLKVNRKQIDFLRSKQRVPLIVELPTTFGTQVTKEVLDYVTEMNSAERGKVLESLAVNQNSWGYRLAYPIFYPLYPASHAADSTKDNFLLVTIRALLARFN